jgi:drug/metabolite transporter (DMT)-like permease
MPVVALLSLVEVGDWRAAPYTDPTTLGAIAYLGAGASAAAWYLWNRGVAGLPAAVAGAFFFVQPVVGGLLARAFLGERLDWRFASGGVLILAGVLLALRSTPARRHPSPPRPAQARRSKEAA